MQTFLNVACDMNTSELSSNLDNVSACCSELDSLVVSQVLLRYHVLYSSIVSESGNLPSLEILSMRQTYYRTRHVQFCLLFNKILSHLLLQVIICSEVTSVIDVVVLTDSKLTEHDTPI